MISLARLHLARVLLRLSGACVALGGGSRRDRVKLRLGR